MKKVLLCFIIIGLVSLPLLAQDWSLVDIQPADEIGNPRNMLISPDGSLLFWLESNTACIYSFDMAGESCYPIPETVRGSIDFTWSPDGSTIAFVQDFFRMLIDSDLWILDVETGTFTNLTEDDVDRFPMFEDDADPDIATDYIPTWSPDGDLYFFRSQRVRSGFSVELYRYDFAADEPVRVADLTYDLPHPLPLYNTGYHQMDGAASISPDGTQMAIKIQPTDRDAIGHGIWMIDMESGDVSPIIPEDQLRVGLPDWIEDEMFMVDSLAWANDTGLVVRFVNPIMPAGIGFHSVYLDTESRTVSPLVDFSDVVSEEDFLNSEDDLPLFYDMPRETVVADGTYFYFNMTLQSEMLGVSAIPLPPDDTEPVRLVQTDEVVRGFTERASAGLDGETLRVLMAGNIFTFER